MSALNPTFDESAAWFARAKETIPGGVNSPVRAYGPVGGTPPFIASGRGAEITDADGRSYIDYVGSWGPLILGHAHPEVLAAIESAAKLGTSFGAPTVGEVELAECIVRLIPSAEMVRLVSSGTEATMTAVRLARGVTGRDKIIKFEGCYHGHADSFLVAAGSGAASHGQPSSPGVPAALADLTLLAPFNDAQRVDELFATHGSDIAAVIVEPIAGNMGCVPPEDGFLERLRQRTREHGTVLIFDEVMTGFRVHRSSAQGLYGIDPDLTTLGKIVGGGLPVGALAGKREWMRELSPTGPVYQAGTLSGNPLSVAAGLAMLRILEHQADSIYERLEQQSAKLTDGIGEVLTERDISHAVQRVGSMFCLYFCDHAVRNFDDARRADAERFKRFFHGMLAAGIYLAPSPYEASFLSTSHDDALIDRTLEALRQVPL